ncbi:MAG: hypothetical protein QSU88_10845, partial [Candidatus Methanoperedens sp.]|nr:hypothetical protein [Candidatus Methanoperedens sp.]
KSRGVDVRTLSDYFGVKPIIINTPVATGIPVVSNTQTINNPSVGTGIPSAPKYTSSGYTIERVYYIPTETQPVATPKPAEIPDLNTQITSGSWVAVHEQENVTKEPDKDKSIFEKIVEYIGKFYSFYI